jgi:hypothetical protein
VADQERYFNDEFYRRGNQIEPVFAHRMAETPYTKLKWVERIFIMVFA